MKKKGILQIPLLSLSNTEKIMHVAKKNFSKLEIIKTENWFLPENLVKLRPLLINLKKKKKISFEENFGKIICQTSIVLCRI